MKRTIRVRKHRRKGKLVKAHTRKIKKNYGMGLYYHGTSRISSPGILSEGLKPAKKLPGMFKMSDQTDDNQIYVFKKPYHANTWAKVVSERTGFKPDVLEIDLPDDKLERDLNMPFGESYRYKGEVPSKKIKRFTGDVSYPKR